MNDVIIIHAICSMSYKFYTVLVHVISASPVGPCTLEAVSLPVQGVGVALNVPTLEEAPCCDEGVAVDDLGLG